MPETIVGFIGLGIMGKPMAKNLLKAGFPLTVYNRTRQRAEELAALGAQVADSPRAVAANSDIVITIVTDSPDVRAVMLGELGVVEGIRPGSIVIDMSTISPQVTREIADALKAKQVQMLDAPVSGGEKGAIEGTLSIMVGGEADTLGRARPVLLAMGKTITHIGPNGMGQVCKLANQIAVGLHNLSISEALIFAMKAGANPAQVLQAIQGGAGNSWAFQNLAPKILRRDFSPGFMVKLQQKDLRLVLDAADKLHLALPGTALTHQLYQAAETRGLGDEGNHALVKALEELAAIEVKAGE
jgi:3-hydroxyisobutyrate dehydrogenase